jgi:hypothetical protein
MLLISFNRHNVERSAMWIINGAKRNKMFRSAGKSFWLGLWIKIIRLK